MQRHRSKTFAALISLLLAPVLASADSTHISTGPVSNWSYGWTSPSSSFTPFSARSGPPAGLISWNDGIQTYPSITFNNTNATITLSNNYRFPKNQIQLHPDNTGRKAVVRWTADASGKYQIQGLFSGLDANGYRDVSIVVTASGAGTSVAFNQILSASGVIPFSFSYTLSTGDTVDFMVGDGGNGYSSDSTGLSALITSL